MSWFSVILSVLLLAIGLKNAALALIAGGGGDRPEAPIKDVFTTQTRPLIAAILSRIAHYFKLEVNTKPPKIPYRETIRGMAEISWRPPTLMVTGCPTRMSPTCVSLKLAST